MHAKVEKRLFLVDSYGFLFRAYHSMPPLTNPAGVPVGGVLGFTNMLLKLKNRAETSNSEQVYVLAVFDAGKKTFRSEIYPAYKENRPEAPEDLIPQFPLVREAADALNIKAIDKVGFEADDIIATYAKMAEAQGFHVTIVSTDKDLMQLISDNVEMLDTMRDRIIRAPQVVEKFGVTPDKVLQALSLIGDSSDNIPGVAGVGPKTAADLLNKYGSIEGIYQNLADLTPKKREMFLGKEEQIELSKRLITLKEDVEVDIPLEDLAIAPHSMEKLIPFLQTHGFRSILQKLSANDRLAANIHIAENTTAIGSTATTSIGADTEVNSTNNTSTNTATQNTFAKPKPIGIKPPTITNSIVELAAYLNSAVRTKNLTINHHLDKKDNLICLTFCDDENDLLIVNLTQTNANTAVAQANAVLPADDLFAYSNTPEKVEKTFNQKAFDLISLFFETNPDCKINFFDAKAFFDITQIAPPKYFDCLRLIEYCAFGTSRSLSQSNLTARYAHNEIYDITAENFQAEAHIHVFALHHAIEIAKQNLISNRTNYIYQSVEKPVISILRKMEIEGIKVDIVKLKSLENEFLLQIKNLEQQIYKLAGTEFNVASTKQLGEVLFETLAIAGGKKSKAGHFVTDSDTLETLSAQGFEIADKVLEFRMLSKLVSTYTTSLIAAADKNRARVHTTYNNTSTTTGRLSSTNPNLQNIPTRSEEGRKIRSAFIAGTNKKLITLDYSQIELRLLAFMADIPSLKRAFEHGEDIHSATAAQIFGINIDDVLPEQRRAAKTVNFGIIYGQSAFGLASQLKISRGEAKDMIDKYFRQYPGIKEFMDSTIAYARTHGYVQTLFGRKIHLPEINDKNGMRRQFAERAAINAPLQGSAADIIKRAMILIDSYFAKHSTPAKQLLQIHDELVIEANFDDAENIAKICANLMAQASHPALKLTVDSSVSEIYNK